MQVGQIIVAKEVNEDGTPIEWETKDYTEVTEADKQAIAEKAAEAVGFPQPAASDNGKFLGCEDGKAAWLSVEVSGGGATEEIWELIDTIPLVKDTVEYEIASFEEYKKIAVTTTKRLVSGSASGTNWAAVNGENYITVRSTISSNFFTYAMAAVVIMAVGNLLKFVQFHTSNNQVMQAEGHTYFLYNGDYTGKRMTIALSVANASNLNEDASIEVYGVRR